MLVLVKTILALLMYDHYDLIIIEAVVCGAAELHSVIMRGSSILSLTFMLVKVHKII